MYSFCGPNLVKNHYLHVNHACVLPSSKLSILCNEQSELCKSMQGSSEASRGIFIHAPLLHVTSHNIPQMKSLFVGMSEQLATPPPAKIA